MIDLHSHILPGIDDGARNLNDSLLMAKTAVAAGTTVLACTPHIKPPTYLNNGPAIDAAVNFLRSQLELADIPLELVVGADIHINHDLLDGLKTGRLPTINGSRYFLFEPDHNVLPPGMERFCASILAAGFIPVLTHPERLVWIERHYDLVCHLEEMGVALQITASSITGGFGRRVQQWSMRMLGENRVDIIASDAHNNTNRSTSLSDAWTFVEEQFGSACADQLLLENPQRILQDQPLLEKARDWNTVAPQRPGWLNLINRISSK